MKPLTEPKPSYAALYASVVLTLVATIGCSGGISEPAARYATKEDAFASAMTPLAELPHRLCIRRAQFTYLWDAGTRSLTTPTPLPPWPDWFKTMGAARDLATGRQVTWERYCKEMEDSGQLLRNLLRALDLHARAVAALAGGKEFDTSSLSGLASGGASIAITAGAPGSIETTVKDASAGVASFTAKFVQWYRQQKLAEAIEDSDACIDRIAGDLQKLVSAIGDELKAAQRQHDDVMMALRSTTLQPPDAPGSLVERSAIVSLDAGTEMDRDSAALDRYAATIERLRAAHHLLAQRARVQVRPEAVNDAVGNLQAAIDDLLDHEWNR